MSNENKNGQIRSRVVYESLEAMIREKAQGWIQDILEEEVTEFFGRGKSERILQKVDVTCGYRNGLGKPRKLGLMNGTVTIRRPRVRATEERFESKVLPLFAKRTKELNQMLPELYLHGLAKGDFELALRGLLGEGAPLSVASIQRLKTKWQLEYEEWKSRDLSDLKLVYQWADGLYVKAGLEKDKAALLIIIGATTEGKKVFLSCEAGFRESKESWAGVLRDLKERGLKFGRLTIADGNLGIWSGLDEVYPETNQQRCWNHKITNVLNALPRRLQEEASLLLCEIPYAETREECESKRDEFIRRFGKDYSKAAETLLRDWDRMVSFYSFPKEHWIHIRTTNVIESPFSSIRLRTNAAKRFKKIESATAMIWKLLMVAEKRFRRLKGYWLLDQVYEGKVFVDGVEKDQKRRAA